MIEKIIHFNNLLNQRDLKKIEKIIENNRQKSYGNIVMRFSQGHNVTFFGNSYIGFNLNSNDKKTLFKEIISDIDKLKIDYNIIKK